MKTLLVILSVFCIVSLAAAGNQGYTVFNYSTGEYTQIVPDYAGGYTYYNYTTGDMGTITPDGAGGYQQFDYGSGNFSTITPDPGYQNYGGYESPDLSESYQW